MQQRFEAVKVTEKVYWVGAIDWVLRDFHGYATHRGSTYNAYLILADKITLVDTVKSPFMDEMLARITSLIDPAAIDYIILSSGLYLAQIPSLSSSTFISFSCWASDFTTWLPQP